MVKYLCLRMPRSCIRLLICTSVLVSCEACSFRCQLPNIATDIKLTAFVILLYKFGVVNIALVLKYTEHNNLNYLPVYLRLLREYACGISLRFPNQFIALILVSRVKV